jgi:hypothetical protein
MSSIYLQASPDGDEEYEVRVDSYTPPTATTRDDPGDGGEVDLSPVVHRLVHGRKVEEITLEEFLERYSTHEGIDRALADQVVQDLAMIKAAGDLIDAMDDSRESYLERLVAAIVTIWLVTMALILPDLVAVQHRDEIGTVAVAGQFAVLCGIFVGIWMWRGMSQ